MYMPFQGIQHTHTHVHYMQYTDIALCIQHLPTMYLHLHCIFILYVLSSRVLLVVVFYCLVSTCILMLATSFIW